MSRKNVDPLFSGKNGKLYKNRNPHGLIDSQSLCNLPESNNSIYRLSILISRINL